MYMLSINYIYFYIYISCVKKKEESRKPVLLSHILQTGKIKDLKGRKEGGILVH